jgi:hypothetical protein
VSSTQGGIAPLLTHSVYAAYAGIYIAVAMAWLRKVDRVPLTAWNFTGAAVAVAGMGIIVLAAEDPKFFSAARFAIAPTVFHLSRSDVRG